LAKFEPTNVHDHDHDDDDVSLFRSPTGWSIRH